MESNEPEDRTHLFEVFRNYTARILKCDISEAPKALRPLIRRRT
jgi:hypothetical protein